MYSGYQADCTVDIYQAVLYCTFSTTETTSGIVFEDGKPVPVDPGRKQWGNEEGSPLIAMLQEKTLQTGTYAVNKEELGLCVWYVSLCSINRMLLLVCSCMNNIVVCTCVFGSVDQSFLCPPLSAFQVDKQGLML